MAEKIPKASKTAKPSKSKKDTSEIVDQTLEPRQIFNFEWDTILRIIGSIAGIVGIIGAMLFILGYYNYAGILNATNIPNNLKQSLPNEEYFLRGGLYFLKFVVGLAFLIGIYYLSQIIKNLTIRINRPIILIILSGIGSILLVFFARGFIRNIYNDMHAALLFLYYEIITISIIAEIAFAKIKHLPLRNYLHLSISPLGKIGKTAFFGFAIFVVLSLNGVDAFNDGQMEGCNLTAKTPISIIWYSTNSIAIEGVSKAEDDSYIFTGYYFL